MALIIVTKDGLSQVRMQRSYRGLIARLDQMQVALTFALGKQRGWFHRMTFVCRSRASGASKASANGWSSIAQFCSFQMRLNKREHYDKIE